MPNDAVVMFEGTIYEDGYGWVAQKVMRDPDLKPQAKAIYAYICSMAGNPTDIDNRKAFPSVSLMKKELGIKSQDTFYKYINQLKDKGYLYVEQEKDESGKFKRNIYKIIAVPKEDLPQSKKSTTVNLPQSKFSTSEKSTSEKWNTNRNSINSNSFNSNSYNSNLSINEKSVSELDLPLIVKKQMIVNMDRLIDDHIDIKEIELIYQSRKEFLSEYQYAEILSNVLMGTKGKIKDIRKVLQKSIKNFIDHQQKEEKPKKVEKLPKWFYDEGKPKELDQDKIEERIKNLENLFADLP